MEHIADKDRFQTFTSTLEERITSDNPARVINAFMELLLLEQVAFRLTSAATGRPFYPPKHRSKLYHYGYYNRIRSFRKLAAECVRNIELHWLTQGHC